MQIPPPEYRLGSTSRQCEDGEEAHASAPRPPHASHLSIASRALSFGAILTCSPAAAITPWAPPSRIPAGVHTLAVPVFATHTQAYRTEMTLTQAVVRELNTRTRYRIAAQDTTADATLSGTVLTQTAVPLTYDSSTGETSSYLLTITVKAVLTARDGRVLYENDALSYREQYQSTQDLSGFIREDSPAVQRLSRDFAQALVSDMLESF